MKDEESTTLQIDYPNMKHLCDEIEAALKEMKSPYLLFHHSLICIAIVGEF